MAVAVALLVSDDPAAIEQFRRSLGTVSISPDVCKDATRSIRLLNRRKFDAVIVDLQLGEESSAILDAVRRSSSNRTSVTFAIRGSGTEGVRPQSDFVFARPLSVQSIIATLKPAYELILRERRRYFRCPISIPIVIVRRAMPEVRCYSLNLSEGGLALSTFVPLSVGEDVQVRFTLPHHEVVFVADSRIVWWRTGHLGVRFVSLSEERTFELQNWLLQKMEETLPEFVAGQFQRAEKFLAATLADSGRR